MERKFQPGGRGPGGVHSLPTGSIGAAARACGGGTGNGTLGDGASA